MSDHYDRYNGMEKLLSTNLAEVGTDCISRKQAIDAFEDTTFTKNEIRRRLSELPPIQPKRGRWKNIVESIEYACGTCDACGARISMAYKYYEYCPRCGAKMKVTE